MLFPEQVYPAGRDIVGSGMRQRHEARRLRSSLQVRGLDRPNHQSQLKKKTLSTFNKDVRRPLVVLFEDTRVALCVCLMSTAVLFPVMETL